MVSSRKGLFVFLGGIAFGFVLTNILFGSSAHEESSAMKHSEAGLRSQNFLPTGPHSHGEMDVILGSGPEEIQKWDDFEDEHHHGIYPFHCLSLFVIDRCMTDGYGSAMLHPYSFVNSKMRSAISVSDIKFAKKCNNESLTFSCIGYCLMKLRFDWCGIIYAHVWCEFAPRLGFSLTVWS